MTVLSQPSAIHSDHFTHETAEHMNTATGAIVAINCEMNSSALFQSMAVCAFKMGRLKTVSRLVTFVAASDLRRHVFLALAARLEMTHVEQHKCFLQHLLS